jgi:hypothetical protein
MEFVRGETFMGLLQRSILGYYSLEIPIQSNGQPIYLFRVSSRSQVEIWKKVDRAIEFLSVTLHRSFAPHLDAMFDDYRVRAGDEAAIALRFAKVGSALSKVVYPTSLLFKVRGSLQQPPHSVGRVYVGGKTHLEAVVLTPPEFPPIHVVADTEESWVSLLRVSPTHGFDFPAGHPTSFRRSPFSRLVTDTVKFNPFVTWPFSRCPSEVARFYRRDVALWLVPALRASPVASSSH